MIIRSVGSVALFCQKCGGIHLQDIPFFAGSKQVDLLCADCGHQLGQIRYLSDGRIDIATECVACGHQHISSYKLLQLRKTRMEKICCHRDNFELGYIGRAKWISLLLQSSQAEFEALHPDENSESVAQQHQLLNAVNHLQDIFESGELKCDCGCRDMLIDIHDQDIVLECCNCGRSAELHAEKTHGFANRLSGGELNFQHRRVMRGKHKKDS